MPVSSQDYMLTTIDNPWNPYTNWEEWYGWDQAHGYDTPGYLARIVNTSFDLSDADQDLALSDAIDEIIRMNIRGIYKRVYNPELTTESIGVGGGGSKNQPPL